MQETTGGFINAVTAYTGSFGLGEIYFGLQKCYRTVDGKSGGKLHCGGAGAVHYVYSEKACGEPSE
jgi:hypothetical protein